MEKLLFYFKKRDLVMYQLALGMEEQIFELEKSRDLLLSLCREIVGQQLARSAAKAIFERFQKLFLQGQISQQGLLEISEQNLRDAGMSWAKVRTLKDLAGKIESGEVRLEELPQLEDKEVIKTLTKVKGIGDWTAEMFLMFSLGRPDVYSFADLGLRKAIEKAYKIDKLTPETAAKIASSWSPYKTVACRILWKSLEV